MSELGSAVSAESRPANGRASRRHGHGRGWIERWWWWLVPILLGSWARIHGLADQVLASDEIHALRAAIAHPVHEILSTFAPSNYSLPLAALARASANAGMPIDEISFRLPAVFAGILFLVLGPLVVARAAGRVAGAVFAALAAVSPLLVVYSRLARPYLPALLLTYATLVSFCGGWLGGRRGRLFVAAALGALAIWVLPVVAPAVAAPWLVAIGGLLLGRPAGCRARWRELAGSAFAGGALSAALLLPAVGSIQQGILDKVGKGAPPSWPAVVEMLAGTTLPGAAWLLVAAGLAGGALAVRRWPGAALIVIASLICQVVALIVARPSGFGSEVVAARYLLGTVPPLLAGVALLVATLWRRLAPRWRRRLAVPGLAALLAAVVAAGPLPRWLGPARPVLSYNGIHGRIEPGAARPSRPMPAGYRFVLGLEPDVLAVAPASTESWCDRLFAEWIPVLGSRLIVGVGEPKWRRGSLVALRRTRLSDAADLLSSDADVVVLHLRPTRELASTDRVAEARLARAIVLDREAALLATRCERAWGTPHFVDDFHAVWDLRRVRRKRAGSARSPTEVRGRSR